MTDAALISKVCALSNYVHTQYKAHPIDTAASINSAAHTAITAKYLAQQFPQYSQQYHSLATAVANIKPALRRFRHTIMVQIITRLYLQTTPFTQHLAEITALADCCLQQTLTLLQQAYNRQVGISCATAGDQQQLLVIGMGKLGAQQLNISSDIDLIFCHPASGATRPGLDSHTYCIRLGQALIQCLDDHTAEGIVFRVDMRLRPYGQSGALVVSFAQLQRYYQEQARPWERLAMTRARVITGSRTHTVALESIIQKFVYRKYIDYSVIASLRAIKQSIRQQNNEQDNNIKLGTGGIREVEFLVQTYQLMYGGQHIKLQKTSTTQLLDDLQSLGLIDSKLTTALKHDYLYLRQIEHVLQAQNDAQTHQIPLVTDTEQWRLIAATIGCAAADVQQHIAHVRKQISQAFDNLVLGEDAHSQRKLPALPPVLHSTWRHGLTAELLQLHTGWKNNRLLHQCTLYGLNFINKIVPAAHIAVAQTRLFNLLHAIRNRSVYASMLIENQHMYELYCKLIASSNWLSQITIRAPSILDVLIRQTALYTTLSSSELTARLREMTTSFPDGDDEQAMELMRLFVLRYQLQFGVAQILGTLPLIKISDALTALAESTIDLALQLAWQYTIRKYGNLPNCSDQVAANFAVIAYGKLAGKELSFTSDLDIVFVYDVNSNAMTDGKRPLAADQFYTRLAQRLLHLVSTPCLHGSAYDVDTRLRPQGSKGMLVYALSHLERYFNEQAWTWEIQALIRARPICGDPAIMQDFADIRSRVLQQHREQSQLRQDIGWMRGRIRAAKGNTSAKLLAGGIVDIEFLSQYLLLLHSHILPTITQADNTIDVCKALYRHGVIDADTLTLLVDSYCEQRDAIHLQTLLDTPPDVRTHPQIIAQWNKHIGNIEQFTRPAKSQK